MANIENLNNNEIKGIEQKAGKPTLVEAQVATEEENHSPIENKAFLNEEIQEIKSEINTSFASQENGNPSSLSEGNSNLSLPLAEKNIIEDFLILSRELNEVSALNIFKRKKIRIAINKKLAELISLMKKRSNIEEIPNEK